jgi:hypothetical protein
MNKPGIRQTEGPNSGIDTGNPKAAIGSFFGAAVSVSIAHTFFKGIFGCFVNVSSRSKESFGSI